MADTYHIQLDLAKIAANLTAAGDPTDVAAVTAWLRSQGMIERGDGWICEQIQARLFCDGEVLEAKEMR